MKRAKGKKPGSIIQPKQAQQAQDPLAVLLQQIILVQRNQTAITGNQNLIVNHLRTLGKQVEELATKQGFDLDTKTIEPPEYTAVGEDDAPQEDEDQ